MVVRGAILPCAYTLDIDDETDESDGSDGQSPVFVKAVVWTKEANEEEVENEVVPEFDQ